MNGRSREEKRDETRFWLDDFPLPPIYDVDAWRTERLRLRSRSYFERAHRSASRPWATGLRRVYRTMLEPVFVAGISALYMGLALRTVALLLGF